MIGSPAPTQLPSPVEQVDLDLDAALAGDVPQATPAPAGGRNHRPAHEDGVGHPLVAEPAITVALVRRK